MVLASWTSILEMRDGQKTGCEFFKKKYPDCCTMMGHEGAQGAETCFKKQTVHKGNSEETFEVKPGGGVQVGQVRS